MKNNEQKKRHGFTLVELLTCIGIAGIVIGAAVPIVQHCRKGGEA